MPEKMQNIMIKTLLDNGFTVTETSPNISWVNKNTLNNNSAKKVFFYTSSANTGSCFPLNTDFGNLRGDPNYISDGIYFFRDFESNKFVRSNFNPLYMPLLAYNKQYDAYFCPFHMHWEKSEKLCPQFRNNFFGLKINCDKKNLPIGFRVSVNPKSNALIKITYICFNPTNNCVNKNAYTIHRYIGQLGENLYMGYLNDKNEFTKSCDKKFHKTLPEEILDFVIRIIATYTSNKYGIKPDYKNLPMEEKLISALLAFPYDPRLFYIKDEIKEIESISGQDSNCFNNLCKKLDIKPWKTFRKLFSENVSVLKTLLTLKKIGFDDVNIINQLLSNKLLVDVTNNSNISGDLCDFSIDDLFDSLDFVDSPETDEDDDLFDSLDFVDSPKTDNIDEASPFESFYAEVLKTKTQRGVANMIERNIKSYEENHIQDIKDAANMYHEVLNFLSPEDKNKILDEGLSHYNHNLLSNIQAEHASKIWLERKGLKDTPYEYNDYEKNLEDFIDGYKFNLAETPSTLFNLGKVLHNCVSSYVKKVLDKQCTILYAQKDDEIKMCIEVRKNVVHQCRCIRNSSPKGDDEIAFQKWRTQKKLRFNGNHY